MSRDNRIARLVPLIHDAFLGPAQGLGTVRSPFLPLLHAYVAIETEQGVACLSATEAAELGASQQQLFAAALENLSERDAQLRPLDASRPDEEVFELQASDGLASSRLLLPGWLTTMRDVLPGEPLCAIPALDRLLVAGSASDDAVLRLLAAAEVLCEGDRALSPVLYGLDAEGLVVPWTPAADHPAAPRLQHAHASLVARVYERQREQLEAAMRAAQQAGELAEDAPLVGPCRVLPGPDGRSLTGTTFVAGVEALLPLSDLVFLAWREGNDEAHYLLVAREDLEALAPHRLVRVPDLDPPRLATLGFPSAEEISRLRACAIASEPDAEQASPTPEPASTNPEPRE